MALMGPRRAINALLAGALTLSATCACAADQSSSTRSIVARNPDEMLKELVEGNERFVAGKVENPRRSPTDFRALADAQYPEAVIVACSDSRVPPELLFDTGVGDLFVIRVAGNVVNGAGVPVKGSIEYAIAELHVPLIVVLGHTSCGAVKAAVKHLHDKDSLPGSIDGLVELIKPAARKAKGETGDVYDNTVRENVKAGVQKLKTLDPIIAPEVKAGKVKVVGGVYDLKTGKVELLPSVD